MSKEKEMLKAILANTQAIMAHLKINTTVSPGKKNDDAPKFPAKSTKPKASKPGQKHTKK